MLWGSLVILCAIRLALQSMFEKKVDNRRIITDLHFKRVYYGQIDFNSDQSFDFMNCSDTSCDDADFSPAAQAIALVGLSLGIPFTNHLWNIWYSLVN